MTDNNVPRQPDPQSVDWMRYIRNRIITGLFLIIPLTVTLWVMLWIYGVVTDWAVNWISDQYFFIHVFGEKTVGTLWFTGVVRIIALIIVLGFLFFVGELGRYAFVRRALSSLERRLLNIPVVKTIYTTTRQIIDAVRAPGGGMFRKVVLFEYPRRGTWVIGFVTNENQTENEIKTGTGQEIYSIFLPTTPNPTSGFLLFVPKSDCTILKMTVTDAMRLIISGGAVMSSETLAALADHAPPSAILAEIPASEPEE